MNGKIGINAFTQCTYHRKFCKCDEKQDRTFVISVIHHQVEVLFFLFTIQHNNYYHGNYNVIPGDKPIRGLCTIFKKASSLSCRFLEYTKLEKSNWLI